MKHFERVPNIPFVIVIFSLSAFEIENYPQLRAKNIKYFIFLYLLKTHDISNISALDLRS